MTCGSMSHTTQGEMVNNALRHLLDMYYRLGNLYHLVT